MSHVVECDRGDVTVTAAALQQLVVQAAESVEGARVRRPRRHLEIAVHAGHARVELELSAAYGSVLPELAREVQSRVADSLARMCGLEVDVVHVAVEELEGA